MAKILALIAVVLSISVPALAQNGDLAKQAKESVGLLYSQDAQGTMQMRCTATAYEHKDGKYFFASAAHCIGSDDKEKEKAAAYIDIPFYITFDEATNKVFYPAHVVGVGYQSRGDDFAIFTVATDQKWPTIPIGDVTKEVDGNDIINIASPLGLGKQVFKGTISSMLIDRPITDSNGINWRGAMFLSIQVGPGSSGSAIISTKQEAIVAFLVGVVGGSNTVAIPASKFIAFKAAIAEGKYRWMVKEEDQ